MFAYGTEDCPRVDLVTGPGNVYVAAAKRLLKGVVGIDSEAGPTEIGILADAGADPALPGRRPHRAGRARRERVLPARHRQRRPARRRRRRAGAPGARHPAPRAGRDGAVASRVPTCLVDDLEQGLAVVDEWAAEHLEVITADARARADRVRNAGAIFVGPYARRCRLGDYLAGSNHVLPTGGTARHTGGLSVQSFLRGIHVIEYDRAALAASAPHIDALGGAEDLAAHVDAVRVRVPRDG